MTAQYRAFLVEESEGKFSGSITELEKPQPQENEVLIKVEYSSLNYKDALCATGVKGVAASYPFVPGIDAVGIVQESFSKDFSKGDRVICSGYNLGMSVYGGFGNYICVPETWIVNCPTNMDSLSAMSYGVAGLTSAACIEAIMENLDQNAKPIVVSGASGGVGSIAVGILLKLGFKVTAISTKGTSKEGIDFFKLLAGRHENNLSVIDTKTFLGEGVRPLDKANFSAGIDTVGGEFLSKILSQVEPKGVVSCCGNVAGGSFKSSVFPFILRGISLVGIDSQDSPLQKKQNFWDKLAADWNLDLQSQTKVITLDELQEEITTILEGGQLGRVVIKHGDDQ